MAGESKSDADDEGEKMSLVFSLLQQLCEGEDDEGEGINFPLPGPMKGFKRVKEYRMRREGEEDVPLSL